MRVFQTGGSVRDGLLGVAPRDRDFLILGATEPELVAQGLVRVGETFPIFLNRKTGDEYTLGNSLEEDLGRRDLTINALAIDENGKLIDLFGGAADIRNKVLRAVNRENFFSDPLRVYRTARFRAQLPGFTIEPETLSLMKAAAASPAFDQLLPDRIIKELKSVFATPSPSQFFETVEALTGLRPHFQELHGKWSKAVDRNVEEPLRFSLLVERLSLEELAALSRRLKIQNDWKVFARAWILFPKDYSAERLMDFYTAVDGFRNPALVAELSRLSGDGKVLEIFERILKIGIGDVDPSLRGKEIGEAIRRARVSQVRRRL